MMTEKDGIQHYSLSDLKTTRKQGRTATRKDAPAQAVDEDFWENAKVVMPSNQPKIHTGIRLDADLVEWFKEEGRGWQTRMNTVLRSYMQSQADKHP